MRPLRALLVGRVNLLEKRGGDTVQIESTCRALNQAGIEATIATSLEPNLAGVDLVHLFNLSRITETAHHFRRAEGKGIPTVLTAIYQDLSEYNQRGRHGRGRWLHQVLGDSGLECCRAVHQAWSDRRLLEPAWRQLWEGHQASQARLVQKAGAVLFTGPGEKVDLEQRFGPVRSGKIIPLGIDREFFNPGTGNPMGPWQDGNHVLSVGRIEDLKNQIGLLDALEGLEIPLVFLGAPNGAHGSYVREFKRRVARRPDTWHVDALPRPALARSMAAARIHVLSSWFENVGLVSLEAAAAGCRVLSTSRGYLRDYLGDQALYFDPGDGVEIREKVLAAWSGDNNGGTRARARQFSWKRTAGLLSQAYEELLDR